METIDTVEKPVTMPKLGMTMTEGTVLNWLYREGDWVEKGEPLVEVMTDKVNMEVEAPFKGRLVHILAQEGEVLPIGAPLAMLASETSAISNPPTSAAPAPVRQEPVSSATILPTISTNTTNRASLPVASTPAAKREAAQHGIELSAVIEAGARPPLDRADILAFVQGGNHQKRDIQPRNLARQETTSQAGASIRATPVAQKIAREHQVNLEAIAERKPGEKITRIDVEAQLAAAQNARQATPLPDAGESELIPLGQVRQLIGQRMVQSLTTAPHIYLDTEIDMTEAERCRQRLGHHFQSRGEPAPSITALLVRATAAALIRHPEVNAALEPGALHGKDAIRRWHNVHIGIAVDTPQALLTPVIRNAQQQSLPELAGELRRLTHAAREGRLKPDDLTGATFTISNLGMYGIDTFHAIIAPGQSAILAVGKVTKRGVVIEDGESAHIEIRPVMKVSLSADHRVLDGASGSRFLYQLKTLLEDPYLLL